MNFDIKIIKGRIIYSQVLQINSSQIVEKYCYLIDRLIDKVMCNTMYLVDSKKRSWNRKINLQKLFVTIFFVGGVLEIFIATFTKTRETQQWKRKTTNKATKKQNWVREAFQVQPFFPSTTLCVMKIPPFSNHKFSRIKACNKIWNTQQYSHWVARR